MAVDRRVRTVEHEQTLKVLLSRLLTEIADDLNGDRMHIQEMLRAFQVHCCKSLPFLSLR